MVDMTAGDRCKTMVCMNCGDIVKGDKCAFCEEQNLYYEVKAVNIPNPIENNLIRIVKKEERLILIRR